MPPFLLASPEHWERARCRIEAGHWAADAVPALARAVEPFRGRPFVWPHVPASTPEAFACRTCGAPLTFNLDRPDAHQCGVCDATHAGDLDRNAAWSCHALLAWSGATRDLAVLGRLTGEAATLADATRLFNALIRHYGRVPHRTPEADDAVADAPGHALGLAADEAAFWWNLLWAREALAAEGRPAAVDVEVTKRAARLATAVVSTPRLGVQHRQVWEMSCLLGLALLLGDGAQLTVAIEHLSSNMAYGFCDDGIWFERSLSYCQPSVLHALTPALLAVTLQGIAIPELERARLGARFLVDAAWADGTLPATNDGPLGISLAVCAPLFHLAPMLWPDGGPLLGAFLQVVPDCPPPWLALLHGREPRPTPAEAPRHSLHAPAAGFSFLRTTAAEVIVKYGPHGGRIHGHPDKLGLSLRAPGTEAVDLGTLAPAHPVTEEWLRRTIGHNTVRVTAGDQEPAGGTLEHSGAWADAAWGAWRCPDIAPDTRATRAVWLHPRGMLDIVTVTGPEAQSPEYWFHARGPVAADNTALLARNAVDDWPTALTDVRRLEDPEAVVTWGAAGGTDLRAYTLTQAAECRLAAAPGNPPVEQQGVLYLRAPRGPFALFVVAYTWGVEPAPRPRIVAEERLLGCAWPALGLHLWRFNWRNARDWCGPPEPRRT